MTERDPLDDILREWHSAEHSPEFDQRVLTAYRKGSSSLWERIWNTRISVPLPVLVFAAAILFALVLWFRPSSQPRATGGGSTQTQAAGFQPLPHGEARVISIKELYK